MEAARGRPRAAPHAAHGPNGAAQAARSSQAAALVAAAEPTDSAIKCDKLKRNELAAAVALI